MATLVDQSNEPQGIASEALEHANKNKAKFGMFTETQNQEIESLRAEVKTVGKVAVQNYIENFDQMKEYDDFVNYWLHGVPRR